MKREDDIFAEALERPIGERAAYLEKACAGNAALRRRIEALLVAADERANFLKRPLIRRNDADDTDRK